MDPIDEFAKSKGFEDMRDMFRMTANADISSPEKMAAFVDWKKNDGTKAGLEKLPKIKP